MLDRLTSEEMELSADPVLAPRFTMGCVMRAAVVALRRVAGLGYGFNGKALRTVGNVAVE